MRGGRLKERDPLFEVVLKWITHSEVIPQSLSSVTTSQSLTIFDGKQWDMTLSMREALARAETLIDQVLCMIPRHSDSFPARVSAVI
jgi:hypothetical protein